MFAYMTIKKTKTKTKKNSDGQQFHKYQQNEQSPLLPETRKTMT